jgi:hypothetical protein
MDVWDHEGNAAAIYREAQVDPADPPGAHGLAEALGTTIRYDCTALIGGAKWCRHGHRDFIFVHPKLSPLVEGMRIYHELAERFLRHERDPRLEQACDQLAYHLRMPRLAFRELIGDVGCDLRALAEPWPATQTASALRYLEVTDTPGVVVTPRDVRARGPEWGWPPADELRRIARGRCVQSGVDRIRIEDRAGSWLLLAS